LIFCAALQVGILREVLTRYALKEDGSEAGAAENRVKFIRINPGEGSAAGYVAKYVSKNIDGGGYQVQLTLEGGQTIDPSERVEAWASTWGIRQFQQIGGPPVGVWREARRLEAGGEYSDIVEAVRVAADVGPEKEAKPSEGWAAFVRLMGGPNAERKALPVRAARSRDGERWGYAQQASYPANPTRYGETARGVVFGLVCARGVWPSRRYRWEVKRAANSGPEFGSRLGVDGFGGFGGSWTRVNNCTDGGESDGKQSGKFSGSGRVDSGSGCFDGGQNAVFTGRGQKGAAGFGLSGGGHSARDGTECGNA
jgi:hypothetical protein